MQVLNIFHVLIAIALVAFVLIQKGQGATAGAAFGSGASGTVFGARGAGNFLSRTTWVLAALFCAISLTMAILVSRMMSDTEVGLGVVGADQAPTVIEAPVGEESPPAALSVGTDESAPIDLPALEPSAEEIAPATDVPAADDGQETGPDEG